ncbi:TPA: VanZ family protein [Listeria innocua]|nr:VanZ family protein [Listeria innocua]ELY0485346.1 VanZ family protein [Listeria innocua]ELY0494161.1 VanZ family protein [Listeria innocua]HBM3583793.1 VanZ family protein [Listeria innocua]HBM3686594.1 VanZ family protein [Listeria innocua]
MRRSRLEKGMTNIKRNIYKLLLFLLSLLVAFIVYFRIFYNILPMYFGNMESLNKNVLAFGIVVLTLYILLKMVFKLQNKWDGYLLLLLYLFVLTIGLLRPDDSVSLESYFNVNVMLILEDLRVNEASWSVLLINLVLFTPMYFLLSFVPFLDDFLKRFIAFFTLILVIESLQSILKVGMFDVTDLLLYIIGFFAGFGVYCCIKNVFRAQKPRNSSQF